MSKQFVCDVCGEAFEFDQPHLELVVQEAMEGAVPEGVWDICSWTCAYDLTLAASVDVEPEEAEDDAIKAQFMAYQEAMKDVGKAIVDQVHEEQIVIDKEDRKYAKEVEDAGVGVYFPEGMRVDGRPASQVRRQVPKVRLVRDDD